MILFRDIINVYNYRKSRATNTFNNHTWKAREAADSARMSSSKHVITCERESQLKTKHLFLYVNNQADVKVEYNVKQTKVRMCKSV